MPSTAERLTALVTDSFDVDHELNFDAAFNSLGISSVDAISFFKLVNSEFDLGLAADDCSQFENLNDVVAFIDARSS